MLENEIRAYALKNSIEYGETSADKVLTKLFLHGLEKKEIGKLMPKIKKVVDEVNSLKKEEKEEQFEEYKKYVKEVEKKEREGLIELTNVKEKPIFRLAPEPSKYLHIGHALSFILNYLYSQKYNGRCKLRFEDCNPEKVSEDYVKSILDDIKNYLGIKLDEIIYVSDDMKKMYSYAESLIKMDKAYMCFCSRENMQDLRHKGIECECRQKKKEENLEEWDSFIKSKYKEGKAVLRIKGDMKSENHVMRDSVIFRIIEKPHFRQKSKYKVWPMYDFYNAIEDSLMGVTHILRTMEFDMRVELQDYIKSLLNLKKQNIVQYGRFNVIESTTKGREIRDLIESKEYMDWDDPRLVTLKALKRRGIVKESFYKLAESLGLSKQQVNIDFNMIASINRKIIDSYAERHSFVKSPVKLEIKNHPDLKEIKIPVHPDKNETRHINLDNKYIYISKDDFSAFKGMEIRLLHLYNINLGKTSKNNVVKSEFTSIENKPIQKINWVAGELKTRILMPDASWIEGYSDEYIYKLKPDSVIQFERFGFCRFDKINKNVYEFWFSHH